MRTRRRRLDVVPRPPPARVARRDSATDVDAPLGLGRGHDLALFDVEPDEVGGGSGTQATGGTAPSGATPSSCSERILRHLSRAAPPRTTSAEKIRRLESRKKFIRIYEQMRAATKGSNVHDVISRLALECARFCVFEDYGVRDIDETDAETDCLIAEAKAEEDAIKKTGKPPGRLLRPRKDGMVDSVSDPKDCSTPEAFERFRTLIESGEGCPGVRAPGPASTNRGPGPMFDER